MERVKYALKKIETDRYFWSMILFAIVLTVLVVLSDYYGLWRDWIPPFLFTRMSVARTMLSTLGGTYLTITTFTFSTTMTVLSTYASSYSPRVVENFIKKPIPMKVLGLFVGGFIYTMVTLFFMKDRNEDVYVIASSVALLYAFIAIFMFVRFIFTVSTSLQEAEIIQMVREQADESVTRAIQGREDQTRIREVPHHQYAESTAFRIRKSGFLIMFDTNMLLRAFKDVEGMLVILPIEGTFLNENDLVARLYTSKTVANPKEYEEIINNAFVVDKSKDEIHDYRFALQKISEIGLRAVSTSTNDPYTAVDALHSLGQVQGRIASTDKHYSMVEGEGGFKLVYPEFNLQEDLHKYYGSYLQYCQQDMIVIQAYFKSLDGVRKLSCKENFQIIDRFAAYSLARLSTEEMLGQDRYRLAVAMLPFENAYKQTRKILGESIVDQVAEQAGKSNIGLTQVLESKREQDQGEIEADASARKEMEQAKENQAKDK